MRRPLYNHQEAEGNMGMSAALSGVFTGILILLGLGALSGCRTPAQSTTVSAVGPRPVSAADSDAPAASTAAPAAAAPEERGVTEDARRENRTESRGTLCDGTVRHLLEAPKASELSALKELLFHRAGTAVECAEREPSLRADALKALVLEGEAGDPIPEVWIAAARRWMAVPEPDPSVVHFSALQGEAAAVSHLWELVAENPVFYLSAGHIPTKEAFEMLASGIRSFDPKVRTLAASAVKGQGEQACDLLAEAVAAEIDAAALAAEIFSMAYIPCPGADEIAVRYATHSDRDVRMASAAVLSRVPNSAHVELLFRMLEDKDKLVVRAAAVAFRNLPLRKEWVGRLVRRAERGNNEDIAVSAVAAAAALGTTASRAAVKRLLKGWARNNAEVLIGAVVAEGTGVSLLTRDALRTAAERGTAETAEVCVEDPTCAQLMIEAMLALARHNDKSSRSIFLRHIESRLEDEVRAAAAWALWRTTESLEQRAAIPFDRDREENGAALARSVSGRFFGDKTIETAGEADPAVGVTVLAKGTSRPVLRLENLSDDGELETTLLVSVLDGDALMPIASRSYGERVFELSLSELHNFEQARPLRVSLKTPRGFYTAVVPPLRSYIILELQGTDGTAMRVRLFSRREVLSTYSDYWGYSVFNNIDPGSAYVDIPDSTSNLGEGFSAN